MSLAVAPPRARPRSSLGRVWTGAGASPGVLAGRAMFVALVAALLVMAGIALVNAVRWVGQPFAGFLLNERLVVVSLAQPDWAGPRAGLRYPDRLLEADGRPLRSARDVAAAVESAGVGRAVTYTVRRGDEVFRVAVPASRFGGVDLLMTFGLAFLSGLSYVAIGAVVFLIKPDAAVSWALFSACVALSVFAFASFDVQSTHWGFVRLALLANALLPAAFVHLALLFPERKRVVERHPSLQAVPYALSLALALPLEWLYPRPSFLAVDQVVRIYALGAAAALLGSTLHAYFVRASALARQRAKVVLFGAALAFPVPALQHVSIVFGDVLGRLTTQNNLMTVPVILFPASVAYAIARHNLFDVDVYIKRAVGYAVMTAVVGLTYVTLQTAVGAVLDPVFGAHRDQVYPLVFALLVVLCFNPLERRVQQAVDRLFFRARLDYKDAIRELTSALTAMLRLGQIVEQVVRTIRRALQVDVAGLVVVRREATAHEAFFVGGVGSGTPEQPKEVRVEADDPLLALVRAEGRLVTRYELEEDSRHAAVREPCLRSFAEMAASLAVPIRYQGELRGVLLLGEKESGHFYSREEVELLTTMADEAAVAIENATTHEEVVRYAQELEASLRRIELLERVKTNLAKFVPVTVQELIEASPEASFDKREIDCSVLFADMTGYTRLSSQLGHDEVNRIVERYFGAFLDEILRRGGDVNETAGDGLMVIFRKRDPRKHARAAALAALGILRRTRELNAELDPALAPIGMKVGVNSGIASVGATKIEGMSGIRWTYTASGPTTNVAARLAALSDNGVVISEGTRGRLGDEFETVDLGPQTLKNVPQPVGAFRLTGLAAAPASPHGRPEAREVADIGDGAGLGVSWPGTAPAPFGTSGGDA